MNMSEEINQQCKLEFLKGGGGGKETVSTIFVWFHYISKCIDTEFHMDTIAAPSVLVYALSHEN